MIVAAANNCLLSDGAIRYEFNRLTRIYALEQSDLLWSVFQNKLARLEGSCKFSRAARSMSLDEFATKFFEPFFKDYAK